MADVVWALSRKKAALVNQKRELTREYEQRTAEIDRQIQDCDDALALINEAVKDILCKTCQGTGTVRKMDAAGQMNDETCPDCRGTGVVRKF